MTLKIKGCFIRGSFNSLFSSRVNWSGNLSKKKSQILRFMEVLQALSLNFNQKHTIVGKMIGKNLREKINNSIRYMFII